MGWQPVKLLISLMGNLNKRFLFADIL